MIKNIFKVLISNILVMLASVVNTLVIPKILSIDGYAEYQTFMLYISYVGLLTFGFHAGMFVKYGGRNESQINNESKILNRYSKPEMKVYIAWLVSRIIPKVIREKIKNVVRKRG